MTDLTHLKTDDPELYELALQESERLDTTLDMIAAEQYCPPSILEVIGSVFNIKTIEGYPGRRFHAGCSVVDAVETLAVNRARELFRAEHANVQPHSGTTANHAVLFSVLKPGDRILSMSLAHGGHLSHGHHASLTGSCFRIQNYTLDPDTEQIDYTEVERLARAFRPNLIIAGASAYPRLIDYEAMAGIAQGAGAFLLSDMAHLAGLVAAGVIPSPVGHSDFVTFTTYKTMMGGRGGVVLCRKRHASRLDRAVFPGCQGTSPVSMFAAKALIFRLAMTPWFRRIQQATLDNAKALAEAFLERGYRLVSGGTDNHQVILDLTYAGISGLEAEQQLEKAGIVTNRNAVPADAGLPTRNSGIRLGTGVLAVRGLDTSHMSLVADLIDRVLKNRNREAELPALEKQVRDLCRRFPAQDYTAQSMTIR